MKFSEMPYKRVDMEQLKADFAKLEADLDAAQSGEAQFAVHQRYYEIEEHAATMLTIAQIRHDIDVTDEFYAGEQDFCDAAMPELQNRIVSYQSKLFHSPYRPYLEKKIGEVAFKNIELAMKSVDPKILPLMQEENALQTQYNKILASAAIDWNGEKLNLSLMRPHLIDPDRRTRQDAWAAYAAFFSAHAEEFDDIYDRLIRNRTKQAEQMGYENYLTLGYCRMRRSSWDRSDAEQFRRQVRKDLVPYAEELHDRRRARLGLSELRYYDEELCFPEGNPAPTGTPEEILEAGRRMYHELSPETAEFMDFMCDNELFDVLGRKTKKTGGYMTYLPDYKAPFIFANFNGTSGDADVITHECGHAFQGWLAAQDPIREHADITMETAETHSMSMEFFTQPWMNLLFGKRAAEYAEMHLEEAVTFIPYGTMVDEFQDICYADPGLSPKTRCEVWRDLEKQYKPHLNYEGCDCFAEGRFWQKQHHIFDCPLYYIEYCIAGTNALQYKAWMDRNFREAWESYLKLCRLSASDYFTKMLPAVGLTVPFEDGCLAYVVKGLRKQ
jgi:M3 family oligoendopeptidase